MLTLLHSDAMNIIYNERHMAVFHKSVNTSHGSSQNPWESDLTRFFSDPKSDPYSNHVLPSSLLEHMVQPHDLSPGLPQEPNTWSPGSVLFSNGLFSAWLPQRIFQNAR